MKKKKRKGKKSKIKRQKASHKDEEIKESAPPIGGAEKKKKGENKGKIKTKTPNKDGAKVIKISTSSLHGVKRKNKVKMHQI